MKNRTWWSWAVSGGVVDSDGCWSIADTVSSRLQTAAGCHVHKIFEWLGTFIFSFISLTFDVEACSSPPESCNGVRGCAFCLDTAKKLFTLCPVAKFSKHILHKSTLPTLSPVARKYQRSNLILFWLNWRLDQYLPSQLGYHCSKSPLSQCNFI